MNTENKKAFKNNCDLCNYHTNDDTNWEKHLSTKKHSKRSGCEVEFKYICEPCDYATNDFSCYTRHLETKKHDKNVPIKLAKMIESTREEWLAGKGKPRRWIVSK